MWPRSKAGVGLTWLWLACVVSISCFVSVPVVASANPGSINDAGGSNPGGRMMITVIGSSILGQDPQTVNRLNGESFQQDALVTFNGTHTLSHTADTWKDTSQTDSRIGDIGNHRLSIRCVLRREYFVE